LKAKQKQTNKQINVLAPKNNNISLQLPQPFSLQNWISIQYTIAHP